MKNYEQYLPVVLAALTVLLLGCMNVKALQSKTKSGQHTGQPSYLWLAVVSLLVGLSTMYAMKQKML